MCVQGWAADRSWRPTSATRRAFRDIGRVAVDASLSALTLSGVTLSPAFHADSTSYTATVENSVASTTVSATATHDSATIAYFDGNDAALTDADAADGFQVALAVVPGYRESVASWAAVLRDLKARGLGTPRLLVADGNLGIWGAAREVWPETAEQRCWNHKTTNVLDRLPKREQTVAREMLRTVPYAPSRAEAVKARKAFQSRYGDTQADAVAVIEDDWERMTAFYDFPEKHWRHLRTTNVVEESPFASVRLRTTAAKRFKRVDSATALIWRLLMVAEKRFRKLNAPHLLEDVYEGRKFEDGKPVPDGRRRIAA